MLLQKTLCIFWFISIAFAIQISKTLDSEFPSNSFDLNSCEICPGTQNTSESSGTLTTPKWNSTYWGPANCWFNISLPVGTNIQINVNDIFTFYGESTSFSYLQIDTSNTTTFSSYTTVAKLAGTYGTVNYTYNLQNNARIIFFVYKSFFYGRFRLTWKAVLSLYKNFILCNNTFLGPYIHNFNFAITLWEPLNTQIITIYIFVYIVFSIFFYLRFIHYLRHLIPHFNKIWKNIQC